MNNSMLSSRCEIILTSMKGGNYLSVTTKQVAKWLNCSEPSALGVLAKMVTYGMLKKVGAASKTVYQFSDACNNNILAASSDGNVTDAAQKAVKFFMTHHNPTSVVTTHNGKKLVKVASKESLSVESQHAVDCILGIIKERDDLKAENELLREEVDRLRSIEEKYKQIKSLLK